MQNFILNIEEVIDMPTNLDVWVVYETEKGLEDVYSLHKLLWKVNFDPRKVAKNYHLEHHTFYNILSEGSGRIGKKLLGSLII